MSIRTVRRAILSVSRLVTALVTVLCLTPTQASAMEATQHLETIVIGAGCFWGVEKRFEAINGVVDVVSGYADGQGFEPTYERISSYANKNNPSNYAEVVKVTFNTRLVSLETLLERYLEMHDPTQLNRQGNDVGTQYRSTILFTDVRQSVTAQKLIASYQVLLTKAGFGRIVTQVKPLTTFYPAESYHQDYLAKNRNGYCPNHATGVKFERTPSSVPTVDNAALLKGKHIVVIVSEDYCPYCEKFERDVLKNYQGPIPVTKRYASQLKGLSVKSPTWATPTILFLNNGKEVFGRQGYVPAKAFCEALGQFILGNSEAYDVAFKSSTDPMFCKQYDIFKNTPDGVFVDAVSGQPLFDTRDRFNAKSGWLSFTKPVDQAVTEHPDTRHGMQRTEIRASVSGIHLGHVFNDGPNGQRRYCINATVLVFVPRH